MGANVWKPQISALSAPSPTRSKLFSPRRDAPAAGGGGLDALGLSCPGSQRAGSLLPPAKTKDTEKYSAFRAASEQSCVEINTRGSAATPTASKQTRSAQRQFNLTAEFKATDLPLLPPAPARCSRLCRCALQPGGKRGDGATDVSSPFAAFSFSFSFLLLCTDLNKYAHSHFSD